MVELSGSRKRFEDLAETTIFFEGGLVLPGAHLSYSLNLQTSAAGSHAPEVLWQAESGREHPALTHFQPPHFGPTQERYSLLDRSTRLPLSSSQYIDPRLRVSMGSDENISVLYSSVPSTGRAGTCPRSKNPRHPVRRRTCSKAHLPRNGRTRGWLA